MTRSSSCAAIVATSRLVVSLPGCAVARQQSASATGPSSNQDKVNFMVLWNLCVSLAWVCREVRYRDEVFIVKNLCVESRDK
jgi:hypothetical protein